MRSHGNMYFRQTILKTKKLDKESKMNWDETLVFKLKVQMYFDTVTVVFSQFSAMNVLLLFCST